MITTKPRIINPALAPSLLPESDITPNNYATSSAGKFDDTTAENLKQAFSEYEQVCETKPLALYFHGGLVDKASGMSSAKQLLGPYSTAGNAYPFFFIWESGLWEVLQRQLPEIFQEAIFQRLLAMISQRAQTIMAQGGAQTSLLPFTSDASTTPTARLEIEDVPADLCVSDRDLNELRQAVASDPVITQEQLRIANAARPAQEALNDSLLQSSGRIQSSFATLMSPDIVAAVQTDVTLRARSVCAPAMLPAVIVGRIALGAASVLARIVERFAKRRDHGFHCTIVEELLREFYIANAGRSVWAEMKRETAEAFGPDPSQYVGAAVVEQFAALHRRHAFRTVLIGHSTGAIYICRFLEAVDTALKQQGDTVTTFDVVFLAPAVTTQLFADTLAKYRARIGSFRAFGMSDALEASELLVQLDGASPLNPLLGEIYTRSLLYFVSGVCEDNADQPLVGMQRFLSQNAPFTAGAFPDIDAVNTFIASVPNSNIRSETAPDAPQGMQSLSHHHGGFPMEEKTLASTCYILSQSATTPHAATLLPQLMKGSNTMGEVFRKHYSFGETIPVIHTFVGLTSDIFQETDKTVPQGPYLKAVVSAEAGGVKISPVTVEPLHNGSQQIIQIADVPVPIPLVKSVSITLVFDIVDYAWHPAGGGSPEEGVVTFNLRCRAAFSILGRNVTVQLDQRPVSITLTKPAAAAAAPGLMAAQTAMSDGSKSEASAFIGDLERELRMRQLADTYLEG